MLSFVATSANKIYVNSLSIRSQWSHIDYFACDFWIIHVFSGHTFHIACFGPSAHLSITKRVCAKRFYLNAANWISVLHMNGFCCCTIFFLSRYQLALQRTTPIWLCSAINHRTEPVYYRSSIQCHSFKKFVVFFESRIKRKIGNRKTRRKQSNERKTKPTIARIQIFTAARNNLGHLWFVRLVMCKSAACTCSFYLISLSFDGVFFLFASCIPMQAVTFFWWEKRNVQTIRLS